MQVYDLHIHSTASHDSEITPRQIVRTAVERGLDGVAITNHGSVSDVNAVQTLGAEHDLDVVSGVELHSDDYGDVLCLQVDEVPENDGSARDIIRATQDAGGIAVIAHPFAWNRKNFKDAPDDIFELADAVETVNARNVRRKHNFEARAVAQRLSIAETGGSDAHIPNRIGRGITKIPDDMTLSEAIQNNKTSSDGEQTLVNDYLLHYYDKLRR